MSVPVYYSPNDFFSVSAIDIDSDTSCDCSQNNNIISCSPAKDIMDKYKTAQNNYSNALAEVKTKNNALIKEQNNLNDLNLQINKLYPIVTSKLQAFNLAKRKQKDAQNNLKKNRFSKKLQKRARAAANETAKTSKLYASDFARYSNLLTERTNKLTYIDKLKIEFADANTKISTTNQQLDEITTEFNKTSKNCSEISNKIQKNNSLNSQFQKANIQNETTLGLYKDSGRFYNTQYIQLWNIGGGIAIAGYMMYYILRNSGMFQKDSIDSKLSLPILSEKK